jgi:hypothetical protein
MSYPHLISGSEEETFDTYSTERAGVPIGARMMLADGREYRYTHVGATALVVGSLNQGVVHTTNYSAEAVGTLAAGVTVLTGVGSTAANGAADQFKFGYAYTDNATTLPMMRIRSNTLITAAAATGTITLFTPTPTAIAAGNTLCYFENPWEDVIVKPASSPTGLCTGWCRTAATELYWCWLQTHGPSTCLYDSTTTAIAGIGDPVGPDAAVAGAVSGLGDGTPDTDNIIGTACGLVEGDTEQTPVFVFLD